MAEPNGGLKDGGFMMHRLKEQRGVVLNRSNLQHVTISVSCEKLDDGLYNEGGGFSMD